MNTFEIFQKLNEQDTKFPPKSVEDACLLVTPLADLHRLDYKAGKLSTVTMPLDNEIALKLALTGQGEPMPYVGGLFLAKAAEVAKYGKKA